MTDSNIWYPTADEVVAAVHALVPVLFPNYEGDTPDFQFIDGDRGRGLLESSLARPKPLFGYEKYVTVAEKAAAMIWSITKNHPFSDGNKRDALTTGILFMLFNHHLLLTGQDEAVEMCVCIADNQHGFGEDDVVKWVNKRIISFDEINSRQGIDQVTYFVQTQPVDSIQMFQTIKWFVSELKNTLIADVDH